VTDAVPDVRDRQADALALALALLVATVYVAPALTLVARHGGVGALRFEHGETLSLTTYGRWWVWPPHRFMTDAFSGDLPTFYNFISDALLNAGSALTGLAPMTFQALVYAPLLGFLFVGCGYLALALVLDDRLTAALAAGIAAFTVSSGAPRLVLAAADDDVLLRTLHVPFHSLALGNGQSLGWVLFFPAVALLFAARERFTPVRAVAHGVVFGLLFMVHTLTFINVAVIAAVYLAARRSGARPFALRERVWAAGLIPMAAAFAWFAWVRPPHTFATLAALWIATMGWLFATDRDRRFYLWSYAPAALVALPYAGHLLAHWRDMAGHDGAPLRVPLGLVLLFFLPQWALAAAAARWAPRTPALRWAAVLVAANLFLAHNDLWAWGNHPYRYAINLVFPLAVLAALGLRHAPPPLAWALGLALVAAAVPPAVRAARNEGLFATVTTGGAKLMDAIRATTDAEPDRAARMLTPPEFDYPEGVVQSTLLLNSASLRSFIPDYRYVLWSERHRNRLALFCTLFPAYPHEEAQKKLRACAESGAPRLFDIVDPRIETAILPVYDIRYAAALGPPFEPLLRAAAQANDWPILARHLEGRLHRVGACPLDGVARAGAGTYSSAGFSVPVETAASGHQRIVIGGRQLEARAPRLLVDGREVALIARDESWLVAEVDLPAGRHEIALPREDPRWEAESDFVYFLAVVDAAKAGRYFSDRPAAPAAPPA
jgi:hypothetical protein